MDLCYGVGLNAEKVDDQSTGTSLLPRRGGDGACWAGSL